MAEEETQAQDKWQQLEQSLAGIFGRARAVADGYELVLSKHLDGERMVVVVYVNGWMCGRCHKADANGQAVYPEARFWRPMRTRVWSLKHHKQLKKIYGTKNADLMTALKTVAFSPIWNSPRPLVRHLKKHFPDLELLPVDEQTSGE